MNEHKRLLSNTKFKNIVNHILSLLYNNCEDDKLKYGNIFEPKTFNIDKHILEIINEAKKNKAEILLDKQASLEKDNYNMRLVNKRNLKGFEKSIEIFLQRNFYYISQKIIFTFINIF